MKGFKHCIKMACGGSVKGYAHGGAMPQSPKKPMKAPGAPMKAPTPAAQPMMAPKGPMAPGKAGAKMAAKRAGLAGASKPAAPMMAMKDGGHVDAKEDKALVKAMVKSDCIKKSDKKMTK